MEALIVVIIFLFVLLLIIKAIFYWCNYGSEVRSEPIKFVRPSKEEIEERNKIIAQTPPLPSVDALEISKSYQLIKEKEIKERADYWLGFIYQRIKISAEYGYNYAHISKNEIPSIHGSVYDELKEKGYNVREDTETWESGDKKWEEPVIKIEW